MGKGSRSESRKWLGVALGPQQGIEGLAEGGGHGQIGQGALRVEQFVRFRVPGRNPGWRASVDVHRDAVMRDAVVSSGEERKVRELIV